jgi:hypothetical protein
MEAIVGAGTAGRAVDAQAVANACVARPDGRWRMLQGDTRPGALARREQEHGLLPNNCASSSVDRRAPWRHLDHRPLPIHQHQPDHDRRHYLGTIGRGEAVRSIGSWLGDRAGGRVPEPSHWRVLLD